MKTLVYIFVSLMFCLSACAHGGPKDGSYPDQNISEAEGGVAIAQEALPLTRYKRSEWKHWIDEDRDCQDTRVEILIRDSKIPPTFKKNGCKVVEGEWVDFYTGEKEFTARKFDIDHVVPLKHAHDNGASEWPEAKKKQFANDPLNLVVALKATNRQKGANDFVNWHPANKERTCEYAQRWFAVKKKYALKVTRTETENLKILGCP